MLVPSMKIANGVATFAMNYFRGVNQEKIRIDFVAFQDGPSPYYEEIQLANSQCYKMTSFKHIIPHIKECVSIIEKGDYDIIHDNTLLVSIPLMWIAKKMKVPVRILHSHSSQLGETAFKKMRNRLFLPALKASATDYMACSESAGKALFGNAYSTFVPNIVNEKSLLFSEKKRSKVREKMGASDKYIVGTVGRMAFQKNPFFALEVIKEAVKLLPNIEYWWIGNGPLESEIKKRIQEEGLDNNVKLLGEREDVEDLYQALDVLFLPSLFEGLPIVGIEAQVMGLPCVMSDNITKELLFTELVHYKSLKDTAHSCAEFIV